MSALFGDLVIVDVLLLPLKELWGKMVIAIRHSTGNANAGFLKRVVLDNRQTRAQSQLRLNEDFDLKPTSQITDMANLSARLARESNRPANDHLQLPGILLTMTPNSDWDLLGDAIAGSATGTKAGIPQLRGRPNQCSMGKCLSAVQSPFYRARIGPLGTWIHGEAI